MRTCSRRGSLARRQIVEETTMKYNHTIGSFRVFAVLLALLTSATAFGYPPHDHIPPTTPTNLQVTAVSPTSVSLSWGPSSDNSGSFFYVLYANNAVVANASMSDTTTPLPGLNSSTTYTFKIRARDFSMNWSGYSNPATAT